MFAIELEECEASPLFGLAYMALYFNALVFIDFWVSYIL